jgi:HEAT repeat protein
VATIDHFISLMRGAVLNSRIYPAGSHIILEPVTAAHSAVLECLKSAPSVSLSVIQGKLTYNSDTEIHSPAFVALMNQHETQRLNFRPGVSVKDIELLALGLSKPKGDLQTPDGLPSWLQSMGVQNIVAQQVQFVAVRKGEDVARQVEMLFGENYEKSASFLAHMDQALEQYRTLEDDSSRLYWRQQFVSRLAGMPVDQIHELLESEFTERFDIDGIADDLIQSMPPEHLTDVLSKIIDHTEALGQGPETDANSAAKLQQLRKSASVLLRSPKNASIPQEVYDRLLQLGLIDKIPMGLVQGEESISFVAQAEHLLSLPSRSLLEASVQEKLPTLFKTLFATQAEGPLGRFLNNLLENLRDPSALNREIAAKSLRHFHEAVPMTQRPAFLDLLSTVLTEVLDLETSPPTYQEMAQNASLAAEDYLFSGRFDACAKILFLIRRHSVEDHPFFQGRKAAAAKILASFGLESTGTLMTDLQSPEHELSAGAMSVLSILGECAAETLVAMLKESDNLRLRQMAFAALRRLGAAAMGPLYGQARVDLPSEPLLRLFSAIDTAAAHPPLAKALELLAHPDPLVRRHVAIWLAKIPEDRALNALIDLLTDPDLRVQVQVVRSARESSLRKLAPLFLRQLPFMPLPVQEEIVLLLAEWKFVSAIPVLIELVLGKKKFLFWAPSKAPEVVRLRAITALGHLRPDPRAVAALQNCLKLTNPTFRRAAQLALTTAA